MTHINNKILLLIAVVGLQGVHMMAVESAGSASGNELPAFGVKVDELPTGKKSRTICATVAGVTTLGFAGLVAYLEIKIASLKKAILKETQALNAPNGESRTGATRGRIMRINASLESLKFWSTVSKVAACASAVGCGYAGLSAWMHNNPHFDSKGKHPKVTRLFRGLFNADDAAKLAPQTVDPLPKADPVLGDDASGEADCDFSDDKSGSVKTLVDGSGTAASAPKSVVVRPVVAVMATAHAAPVAQSTSEGTRNSRKSKKSKKGKDAKAVATDVPVGASTHTESVPAPTVSATETVLDATTTADVASEEAPGVDASVTAPGGDKADSSAV